MTRLGQSIFYDFETSGTSPAFDQVLQVAAIRTDEDLQEIDRIEMRCRLQPHILPHPGALRTTGMSLAQITDGRLPCHYEMVREFRAWILDRSPATVIGYNSIRFDEQMLRHALMRSLSPPYLTSQHGNRRADVLSLAQAASVFAPGCIQVPQNEAGRAVFKLDRLAPANDFAHENAHDALADVEATIHLARCVRDGAPNVWSRFLRFSDKGEVSAFAKTETAFLLTEFYFNRPFHTVVAGFAEDPGSTGTILCLDLSHDLDRVRSLTDDQLATWVAQSPRPVRRLKANAGPILTPLVEAPAAALGSPMPEEARGRGAELRGDRELRERLVAAVAAGRAAIPAAEHPEERLYESFIPNADLVRMERFHASGWHDRAAIVESFEDERLRYFGRLLLLEMRPELLEQERRTELRSLLRNRLLNGSDPRRWTSIPMALAALEACLADPGPSGAGWCGEYRRHLEGLAREDPLSSAFPGAARGSSYQPDGRSAS